MTNHQTCQDSNQSSGKLGTPDFSKFMVHDSYQYSVTDTASSSGVEPAELHRISKRQLEAINNSLSERDKQILLAVQKYRYMMSGQIKRLLFTETASPAASVRAASRNLKKLRELGLVNTLSRRIGGVRAGSSSMIYYITHAGERLLRLNSDEPHSTRRFYEPSPYFLAHTLAVAEVAVRLTELCREHAPELAALQLEPACWRTYSDYGTALSLKPDLYIATATEEYEDRYFLEIDLDTESPAKVLEKCEKYHKYYRTGLEQEESEMFPLTVWIVPNIARKERLIAHIREAFSMQPKLFAVITDSELERLILQGGDREMLC